MLVYFAVVVMSHILSMSFQFYFVQKRAMLSKLVVHLKIKYKIVVVKGRTRSWPGIPLSIPVI